MVKIINKIISNDEAGGRADKFLSVILPKYSRASLVKVFKSGRVFLNGLVIKPATILKSGDNLSYQLPDKIELNLPKGEDIDLDIIYEDDNTIVLNKQAGLVVHPAAGNPNNTLVNGLIEYHPKITSTVDNKNQITMNRPGLVQRLDKDTSGVMIVAKNHQALIFLSSQIKNRNVKKIYLGVCYGWPKNSRGRLINHLGRHPKRRQMITEIGPSRGREAISDYCVKKYFEDEQGNKLSLIEFSIQTGRTHQIRVQSSLIGIPIMGDLIYGHKQSIKLSKSFEITRQLLHSHILKIRLSQDSKFSEFKAPIPADFNKFLTKLINY